MCLGLYRIINSINGYNTSDKPNENFQHINFYLCHPPGITKGFIKTEALRLLRTNSSQLTSEENMKNFKKHLLDRGYPTSVVQKHLSGVKFSERKRRLN